jgi:outer membrane protein OmpA-like peptidoglycan-associated protein
MKKIIRPIVFLLFFANIILSCRQTKSVSHSATDGKEKYLAPKYKGRMEADYFFGIEDYERAEKAYRAVLKNRKDRKGMKYEYARLQLARLYYETRQFEKSRPLYDLSINGNDLTERDVNNYLDLLKRFGEIDRGIVVAKRFDSLVSSNTRFGNIRKSLDNYPAYFNAKKLDVDIARFGIDMQGSQYGVSTFRDGIVFISNYTDGTKRKELLISSRMYYFAGKDIVSMNRAVKYTVQAGPATFYDNDQKMIYTTNYRRGVVLNEKQPLNSVIMNTTRLMSASFNDGNKLWRNNGTVSNWISPRLSRKYSFMHPFLTEISGAKRLYFSSNIPGGYGGMDIYYADWDAGIQEWGSPVNVGPAVNTNGDELYPAYYDGKLFFASNGQVGFGGLDIYWYAPGRSTAAVHLPYPYNTQYDDFNVAWDRKNDNVYFTSDRGGVSLHDKIYKADMKQFPLADLGYDISSKELIPLATNAGKADSGKAVAKSIPGPLDYKIFFEFNSDAVNPSQKEVLDSVYNMFHSLSNAMIDICGYADAIGTETYNYKLSKRRAEKVREYLQGKGIPSGLIGLFYYGDTRPAVINEKGAVQTNRQEAIKNEAMNRRCVIRIKARLDPANQQLHLSQ